MRNLLVLLSILLLTSCSSLQLKYSVLNHVSNLDGIYSTSNPTITVIDNEFELDRRFRTDDRFRWDFAQYAMNQDLRWNYDFYFNNRMHRSGFGSPFDFHWNSNEFWWDWASNYQFNNGFNQRNRFGFNGNFGWNGYNNWGYGNSWYNPYNRWGNFYNPWNRYNWGNRYGWNNSYYNQPENRRNVSYSKGRRGSTNNVVPSLRNDDKKITPRVRVNQGRRITTSSDVDVVIKRPERNALGRFIYKMEGNGIKVRTYQNPNNTPTPRIRNYNRVENNNRSNNNIIIRRNSNSVRQTPTRTAPTRTTPPTRSNNTGRSGGGVSVSKSSRGNGKIN